MYEAVAPLKKYTVNETVNGTLTAVPQIKIDETDILSLDMIKGIDGCSLRINGDAAFGENVSIPGTSAALTVDTIQNVIGADILVNSGINVEGNARINPNKTVFTDRITAHPDPIAPMIVTVEGQMNVEGVMDLGSHDLAPENVYSDSYVKTKFLGATAGATGNQIGVTSDLALLESKKLMVDYTARNS